MIGYGVSDTGEKPRRVRGRREMASIAFDVWGPLRGYRASRFGRKRKGRWTGGHFDGVYKAFKDRVLAEAIRAGWRHRQPTPRRPVYVRVEIFWKALAKIDWKNLIGAIEDSLYGKDRYVFPREPEVTLFAGHEHAIVTVYDWEEDGREPAPQKSVVGRRRRATTPPVFDPYAPRK